MTNKDSDQPAHPTSFAKFLVHPSFASLEAVEGTCEQQRLWSECVVVQACMSLPWLLLVGFVVCWLMCAPWESFSLSISAVWLMSCNENWSTAWTCSTIWIFTKHVRKYSRTSIVLIPMARFHGWLELVLESQRYSSDNYRKQIFKETFSFYHGIVCCVYSLESPHWVHSTYHCCIEDQKDFPKLSPLFPDLAPWLTLSGSNYPCLEQIFTVLKMFEPLKFDCIISHWEANCTWGIPSEKEPSRTCKFWSMCSLFNRHNL